MADSNRTHHALAKAFKRLRADRRGATALEFALVAAPFIFMIFAIIELALVFMVNVTLDNATAIEGRKFRTGQECIDSASDTTAVNNLKQNICNNMSWLEGQCMNNLYVDVRSFASFNGAGSSAPTKTNAAGQLTFDPTQLQDTSGGASSVNVLTAYYNWTLLTPFLYAGLQSFPGTGQHMLISSDVLSFEPFGQPTSSCTQG
ncbi:MAG: TadE/TadG family type IV pilus assembly protein [Caulobacteraceae bacterium]